MENLEEVLQALDEFQKMRPTEIPRELEDYLCWVAKTGDPVYQWSLIKTLFREKLTRVMTDFYESCPSLELASCPNVEHFNYDTMKSNLLERLESFANAPFTLQRICELLTSPRKEYNRVDKFMRAIEKNILVVSTKEPGPIARRSENGEGMVNGSVEDETPVTQPSQDVEMQYWEKDCASTVTISVHTVESETPLLHTVIPTATVVKSVFGSEENTSHEKLESTSAKPEISVSNFIPTSSEFSGTPSLSSQAQSQESSATPTLQNLSTIVPEASGIVGDVPEAIMNEDTSSQPSLDLENEENDGESTRKLQTTFQAKDFASGDSKSSKFYLDNSKPSEKAEATPADKEEETVAARKPDEDSKSDSQSKEAGSSKMSADSALDHPAQATNDKSEDKAKSDSVPEGMQLIIEESEANTEERKSALNHPQTETVASDADTLKQSKDRDCGNTMILSKDEPVRRTPQVEPSQPTEAAPKESVPTEAEDTKGTEAADDPKPIIEEPTLKETAEQSPDTRKEKDGLVITEAVDTETRVLKSMVPDPIPIVEEPKDTEPVTEKPKETSTLEITEATEAQVSEMDCQEVDEKLMTVEEPNEKTNEPETDQETEPAQPETTEKPKESSRETKRETGQETGVELMEVDEEEAALSIFQQDEPMEQETVELSKS